MTQEPFCTLCQGIETSACICPLCEGRVSMEEMVENMRREYDKSIDPFERFLDTLQELGPSTMMQIEQASQERQDINGYLARAILHGQIDWYQNQGGDPVYFIKTVSFP